MSEETIIKFKNKIFTKEHRKNLSESRKGKPLSKEHVDKIRAMWKKPEMIEMARRNRIKRVLPYQDTSIEVKIQNFLSQLHIEFFTHKYVSDITHAYQCDILILSIKTIIECDGCYFHACLLCDKNKGRELKKFQLEHQERDNIRTKELQDKGYNVIRLWEHDINSMQLNDFKERLEQSMRIQ